MVRQEAQARDRLGASRAIPTPSRTPRRGTSGKRRIGAEDLARIIGTIPYEITARLGRRVARVAV